MAPGIRGKKLQAARETLGQACLQGVVARIRRTLHRVKSKSLYCQTRQSRIIRTHRAQKALDHGLVLIHEPVFLASRGAYIAQIEQPVVSELVLHAERELLNVRGAEIMQVGIDAIGRNRLNTRRKERTGSSRQECRRTAKWKHRSEEQT